MPYPQNLGLANAVDRLRQRNQMNAMQPVAPYTGSPGENPSPAGLYANSGMAGGMSNYQAQQNYGQTGYMPNRTVGGAYGLGGIPNRLGSQQVLQQASGNQYAPMGLAANSNLGGRLWGGATPDYVAGRPAWTTGPREGRSMTPEQNAQYAVAHGLYFDAKTGAMGGNPALQSGLDPQQQGIAALGMSPFGKRMTPAEAAQVRAGGAPGPNAIAAQAREGQRGGILNRVAIRQQNAQQAQDNALAMQQQQMMLGLAQRNPALAMQMAQMNQRGQLAQQQMGLQYAQLNQRGTMGQQQSRDRRYVADRGVDAQNMQAWNQARLALMKEGHSPADVNAYLGPPPTAPGQAGPTPGGLLAQPGAPTAGRAAAGYKPKKPLMEAQIGQVASAPPGRRAAMLRAFGVTDPSDIHHYQSQIDPNYNQPTLYDRIINSPATGLVTEGAAATVPSVNPFAAGGLLGQLAPSIGFGYQAPPPVRPRRR